MGTLSKILFVIMVIIAAIILIFGVIYAITPHWADFNECPVCSNKTNNGTVLKIQFLYYCPNCDYMWEVSRDGKKFHEISKESKLWDALMENIKAQEKYTSQ